MQTVKTLDKEITRYLGQLTVPQKEAVLNVVKTFAREEPWWDDDVYVAEMNSRFSEMESGEVKGITLEEMEAEARRAYRSRKSKK
jgi:hypothetical protein